MNEYLIQGETLTELGDKIRVLTGTENSMTPIQMTSNVQSANEEVDAQSVLIDQLSAALEGKAGGSNSEVISSVNTCTVTINSFNNIEALSYTAFENEKIVTKFIKQNSTTSFTLENVVCGSAIVFYNHYDFNGFTHTHDSKYIGQLTIHMCVLSAPTEADVNATITIFDDD